MNDNRDLELIKKAKEALQNAYAPYSKFQVGAALLSASGRVFLGCNIENASFSVTICAERAALSNAITQGERDFVAIAIASSDNKICPPCGVCRQALAEFAPHMRVLLAGDGDEYKEFRLSDLLPEAFTGTRLSSEVRGCDGRKND